MRYILGISAYYHDSAACLLRDGDIIAAAQEERFSRRKHDARFPNAAVAYCLDHAGITAAELGAVAFYDKPWLKFERLLETYLAHFNVHRGTPPRTRPRLTTWFRYGLYENVTYVIDRTSPVKREVLGSRISNDERTRHLCRLIVR